MAAIVEDFLVQVNTTAGALAIDPNGLLTPHPGAFVAIQNINTTIDATVYVSDTATDASGKWIIMAVTVPSGTYKQAWGTTAQGARDNLLANMNIVRVDFQVHPDPERFKETAAALFGFGTSTPVGAINDVTLVGNAYIGGGKPWYDVRQFGAVGDGLTDDRLAIQAACNACRMAGGGIVFLPPGTYAVSLVSSYAIGVGSNTIFLGAGRDATTIFLLMGAVDQQNVISNYNAVGDEKITYQDFTIDGNAVNQTNPNAHVGLNFGAMRHGRALRVRVRNIRGTSVSGAGEGSHIRITRSTDVGIDSCETIATSGVTADGVTADTSTHCTISNTFAYGMSVGMGFTQSYCRNLKYLACAAYLNIYGFNCEDSDDTVYEACQAGGLAAPIGPAGANYPFAANASLGNANYGFISQRCRRNTYIGCIGKNCIAANAVGLYSSHSYGTRVVGCDFSDNNAASGLGLAFVNPTSPVPTAAAGTTAFVAGDHYICLVPVGPLGDLAASDWVKVTLTAGQQINVAAITGWAATIITAVKFFFVALPAGSTVALGLISTQTVNAAGTMAAFSITTGGALPLAPPIASSSCSVIGTLATNNTAGAFQVPYGSVNFPRLGGLIPFNRAPPITALGVPFTNPFPFNVDLLLSGGTYAAINVDGLATGITGPPPVGGVWTVPLAVGSQITVIGAVLPTVNWVCRAA
jgi:hypothetical protein